MAPRYISPPRLPAWCSKIWSYDSSCAHNAFASGREGESKLIHMEIMSPMGGREKGVTLVKGATSLESGQGECWSLAVP